MTALIRFSISLMLCIALTATQAAESGAAVITTVSDGAKSNSFEKAFVLNESVDGIDFTVDDPRSANKLNLKFGTYIVTWGDPVNLDYMKGKVLEEAGQFEKALEAFQRAAIGAKIQWVKEDSQLHGAQLGLLLKKYDEALTLVAALEKDNPRSVRLAKALLVRGQCQMAKGDAAATATFTTLAAMSKDWGPDAAIYGARGQAEQLSKDKKFTEAADILGKLIARIDANKQRVEIGGLAFACATAQRNAGKDTEALATIQAYVWKDIEPTQQAQLHILWGSILAQQATVLSLTAGFDQAALAACTKGADPATLGAAKTLALSINDKLSKDPAVSAADKAEFKRMISLF